jgi:hypothetical protein
MALYLQAVIFRKDYNDFHLLHPSGRDFGGFWGTCRRYTSPGTLPRRGSGVIKEYKYRAFGHNLSLLYWFGFARFIAWFRMAFNVYFIFLAPHGCGALRKFQVFVSHNAPVGAFLRTLRIINE